MLLEKWHQWTCLMWGVANLAFVNNVNNAATSSAVSKQQKDEVSCVHPAPATRSEHEKGNVLKDGCQDDLIWDGKD